MLNPEQVNKGANDMSTQTIAEVESVTVAEISQRMQDFPHWQKPFDRLIQQPEVLAQLPDSVRRYMQSGVFRTATHLYVFKGRVKKRCEIVALAEVVFDEIFQKFHCRYLLLTQEAWNLPVSRRLTVILDDLEEKLSTQL